MKNKKHLIKNFYFPKPNWAGTSPDILKLSKKGLSKEDGYLLDGIKLAWLASVGRDYLYKKAARGVFVSVAIIILAIIGYELISQRALYVNNVSAKTVTSAVGGIVEATMSAVFK